MVLAWYVVRAVASSQSPAALACTPRVFSESLQYAGNRGEDTLQAAGHRGTNLRV